MDKREFIEMIAPLAVKAAKDHDNKIYASVCIAQACKETGFGSSSLMMRYNAPFGIKVGNSKYHFGSHWRDKSFNARTKEVHNGEYQIMRDDFRAYDSLEDAVYDYFDLLCTASRYKAALNAPSYSHCIRAIAPSYATAEQINHCYSNSVIQIIELFGLYEYDGVNKPYTATLETTSDLNLRTGAGVEYDVIEVIPAGAKVEIHGFVPAYYNGVRGYVHSQYLKGVL